MIPISDPPGNLPGTIWLTAEDVEVLSMNRYDAVAVLRPYSSDIGAPLKGPIPEHLELLRLVFQMSLHLCESLLEPFVESRSSLYCRGIWPHVDAILRESADLRIDIPFVHRIACCCQEALDGGDVRLA